MKDKIIISEQFRDYIEGLNYEKNARAKLINFMLDCDINNEQMFKKINTEYLEYYSQFEIAKSQLEQIYLKSLFKTIPRWRLNFESMEVCIYE